MKIIKLESKKIEVLVSEEELIGMDITPSALLPPSPQLSRFLGHVLDKIESETGFGAFEEQVVIEAEVKNSGIVLTLSGLSKKSPYKISKKIYSVLFEFPEFDDLSALLQNIPTAHLFGMRLYAYSDRFFLAVPRRNIPVIIYEYSLKKRKSSISESIIAEHGKKLADGYGLACMAAELKKIN